MSTPAEPAARPDSSAEQAGRALDPRRLARVRRLNIVAAALHAVQAGAVLALANDFSIPVTAAYMEGPPGTPPGMPVTLVDVPLAYGVALFFALSALFHLLVAAPFRAQYEAGLAAGHNYFRWAEYAISSSVMIVLIAQLCGIVDAGALMAIFGVNASMILFGWLQERYERPGAGMLPFAFGCFAGVVPWLVIALYALAPGATRDVTVPAFVVVIVISLFTFFNCFAVVQYLQYKRVGRFADYLVGERTYLALSLVAKSLLAWQVFSGALAG